MAGSHFVAPKTSSQNTMVLTHLAGSNDTAKRPGFVAGFWLRRPPLTFLAQKRCKNAVKSVRGGGSFW